MCLAVPGKILDIIEEHGQPYGMIDFQGSQRQINIGFTPGVEVGQWVLVHAGFSINTLDEAEARETWAYLKAADMLDEVDELDLSGIDDLDA